MSVPGFMGSIDPVGIAHARHNAFHKCVPDIEAAIVIAAQFNDLDGL